MGAGPLGLALGVSRCRRWCADAAAMAPMALAFRFSARRTAKGALGLGRVSMATCLAHPTLNSTIVNRSTHYTEQSSVLFAPLRKAELGHELLRDHGLALRLLWAGYAAEGLGLLPRSSSLAICAASTFQSWMRVTSCTPGCRYTLNPV